MTVTDAIRTRRSIRKYQSGAPVTQEQIELMLEAAMMAPSACNTRPWEFVVVRDNNMLKKITEIHPYTKMLQTASLAIIVCALPEAQREMCSGYFPQDCGAATQNILLQAVELGFGGCWCGVYPVEERVSAFKELLGVESIPFNVIAIGVPDESVAPRGYYDANKVRYIG